MWFLCFFRYLFQYFCVCILCFVGDHILRTSNWLESFRCLLVCQQRCCKGQSFHPNNSYSFFYSALFHFLSMLAFFLLTLWRYHEFLDFFCRVYWDSTKELWKILKKLVSITKGQFKNDKLLPNLSFMVIIPDSNILWFFLWRHTSLSSMHRKNKSIKNKSGTQSLRDKIFLYMINFHEMDDKRYSI